MDKYLEVGVHYYRLKAIDQDGTFSYSDIKAINIKPSTLKNSLSLYPNPAQQRIVVDVTKANASDTFEGGIYDILGERLIEINEKNPHVTKLELDISSLIPGKYICRIQIGQDVIMKKLIKTQSE